MTFKTSAARHRWDRDPEYVRNRATLRAQRRPCARCGKPIDYDGSYWIPLPNGRKKINGAAFVAGHVIGRAFGGDHSLANLQSEHARCSLQSGAREGNYLRAQRAAARSTTTRPTSSSRPAQFRLSDLRDELPATTTRGRW
jgi:hypothetical protein